MPAPIVAIVGRPNVGKSSLFNAICGGRVAIVEPTPGVTRDRISRLIPGHPPFELIDTGGMGLHDSEELAEDIERQIAVAIEHAHLVVFVTDAKAGIQPADHQICRQLRRAGKRLLLVANKCDGNKERADAAEFYELGIDEVILTAAAHAKGVRDVVRAVRKVLPAMPEDLEEALPTVEPMNIAFVGRRNVGKSSLVNYLAREPRCIVSEIPGTTRDSVDVQFRMDGLDFVAIDTAGLRRTKQVKNSIDFYSSARAESAIKRADVVVHVLESVMELGRIDKQLASMISDSYKPCVLAMNKMDLAGGISRKEFREYVRDRMRGANYFPLVFISAKSGDNVRKLVETCQSLHEQSFIRINTSDLNNALEGAVKRRRPPSTPSKLGKIYYGTQVAVKPPTIALFTNEPKLINKNYLRYLGGQMRKAFGFGAIPIKFVLRGREPDKDE